MSTVAAQPLRTTKKTGNKPTNFPKQAPVLEGAFVYPASKERFFGFEKKPNNEPEQDTIPANKKGSYRIF